MLDTTSLNTTLGAAYLPIVKASVPPGAKLISFKPTADKITIDYQYAGAIRPNTVTIPNTVGVSL